ncbi:uncharacterized protein LOC111249019 [Varroa destructor]|uniref:G-protein coupled receptors family 1 profile domain-containing protein n=1 Tax=Varroa destructor TaxID=109461 RepID=A0A7M7JW22_VARDE|nr:uncharacterized protein LOC111249019 [Varroa destructor]
MQKYLGAQVWLPTLSGIIKDLHSIEQDAQAGHVEIWTTIANSYIQPVLSAFGIVGNVFMLLTIHYGHLSDSPYVYLKCIALGDLILLIVICGLSFARCATCQFSLETAYYLKLYDRYVYLVLSNLMIGWLVLLTLVMTIERFVYVRWPIKTQSWCTRERAKRACVILFLIACSSQPLRMFEHKVSISEQKMPPIGTSLRHTPDFNCSFPDGKSNLRCYNDDFPLATQQDSTDPCPWQPRGIDKLDGSGFAKVPQSADGLHSVHCLHTFCRLPLIPRNAPWTPDSDVERMKVIKYEDNNNITAVALGVGDEFPGTQSGDLVGTAYVLNDTCWFLISPAWNNRTPDSLYEAFLAPILTSVKCVQSQTGLDLTWKGKWRRAWLLMWDRFNIVCTGILITFNVMIVFLVHRANQEAHERVLSANKQAAVSKRRKEENRLTMSLMALCCVKIISEVTYISSDEEFAWIFYTEYDPPGVQLKFHQILSNVVVIFEYSSYFYLLAFINRKFKREFLKQVVYGKFLRQRYFGSIFNTMSLSSHGGSIASTKDCNDASMSKDGSLRNFAALAPTSPNKRNRKQNLDLERAIQEFGDKAL